ncbi:MAG: ATP-binding cassette domain-containing protein [Promethearchaeota archaeon]|nr:MAG: ATP-binding cassette domain-containing protein [Candidatus Lokiarchaeota archaeon]
MKKINKTRIIISIFTIFLFFTIWYLISIFTTSSIISTPLEVFNALIKISFSGDNFGYTILDHIFASLLRVVVGFYFALIVAVPLGLIMGLSEKAEWAVTPIIEIFRPIPPFAWIPFALIFFGLGLISQSFIIFIGAFFPILTNTLNGVKDTSSIYIDVAKTLGANRADIILHIILPSTLPSILVGIRVGLGVGWMCVIAAELVGLNKPLGLGYLIQYSAQFGNFSLALAAMMLTGVIGYLINNLIKKIEVNTFKWREHLSIVKLKVKNLSKSFHVNHKDLNVLESVALEVFNKEFFTIVGPSGCGKTTLIRIIAGLERPTHGKIYLNDQLLEEPSKKIGYIPQDFSLFPWKTVEKNISFGLDINHVNNSDAKSRIDDLLTLTGLTEFKDYYPKNISGGMKQKVAIARSLAINQELLLLDEPLRSIDAQSRNKLQDDIIGIWERTERTMIFITHNIDEAVYLSDRIAILSPLPGSVKKIVPISLERPRDRTSSEFNIIRKKILELVF